MVKTHKHRFFNTDYQHRNQRGHYHLSELLKNSQTNNTVPSKKNESQEFITNTLSIDLANIKLNSFENIDQKSIPKIKFTHIRFESIYFLDPFEWYPISDDLLELAAKITLHFKRLFPGTASAESFVFEDSFITDYLNKKVNSEYQNAIKNILSATGVDRAKKVIFNLPKKDGSFRTSPSKFVENFEKMLRTQQKLENIQEIYIYSQHDSDPISLENFSGIRKLKIGQNTPVVSLPESIKCISINNKYFLLEQIPKKIRDQITHFKSGYQFLCERGPQLQNVIYCSIRHHLWTDCINNIISIFPNLRHLKAHFLESPDLKAPFLEGSPIFSTYRNIDTVCCAKGYPQLDLATRFPNLRRIEVGDVKLDKDTEIKQFMAFLDTLRKCEYLEEIIIRGVNRDSQVISISGELGNELDSLSDKMISQFELFKKSLHVTFDFWSDFPESFQKKLAENLPDINFNFNNPSIKFQTIPRPAKKPINF